MNILIRGGNFRNKGDEGMTRTVIAEVRRRIPDSNFWLVVPEGQMEPAHAAGIFPVCLRGNSIQRAWNLSRAMWRHPGQWHPPLLVGAKIAWQLEVIQEQVDAVIDISGFGYSDVWGMTGPRMGAAWVQQCKSRRRPYVFLPQAWGPFTHPPVRTAVSGMCLKAARVYARDSVSLQHLAQLELGDAQVPRQAPDIAFRFSGDNPAAGLATLRALGLEPGKQPIVAMTPNMRIYERMPGRGAGNAYVRLLADVARLCMRDLGAAVLLIPHEIQFGNGTVPDDRFLCGLLKAELAQCGRCEAMSGTYLAPQIKTLYHHVDLIIGSRYHSLVFAMACGVPAVALAWAHKYRELMQLFDLNGFVMEHDALNKNELWRIVSDAWTRRDELRRHITAHLPSIQNSVSAVFDDVATILQASIS